MALSMTGSITSNVSSYKMPWTPWLSQRRMLRYRLVSS